MVHTLPPWTTKYRMVQVFGSIDVNESAARLGSINTFQREGNVLWMDDFESATLGWAGSATGTAGVVALTTKYHRSKSQCAKLYPGAGTAETASLYTLLPIRNEGVLGYEICWCGGLLQSTIDFQFYRVDGTNTYKAEIRFDVANDKLQYLNSGGTYTDIPSTSGIATTVLYWHILKLVVDFTNNKYKRVYVDHNEYSLADLSIQTDPGGGDATMWSGMLLTSAHPGNQPVYVDNFILTENER